MKILHLDIETAPHKVYSWGLWNQNISINQIVEPGYTLCWAAKWHGKAGVMYNSIHNTSEKEMLEEMIELLNQADVVVHYNGKKFDMPTLHKEFIVNDLTPPSPYKQIDLLPVVRKEFRFPSNKLDYVAQQLKLGGKVEHKGMPLWTDCMAGVDKAWKHMEKYNKQDVVLLEKLYNRLLPHIKQHPNHALYKVTDRPVCTNCGASTVHKRGVEKTKTQIYQRYQCTGCGTWMKGGATLVPKDKRHTILTQV